MSNPKESFIQIRYRNPGHWDIWNGEGRIMRTRGGPGAYMVLDDRPGAVQPKRNFNTLGACMTAITDELMHELIVAKGQVPTEIESWNV